MKKGLLSMLAIMMVAVVGVTVISCGDDNVESGSSLESILKSSVWKSAPNYEFMMWGDNYSLSKENVSLYFQEAGKGIGKSHMKETDTYFGSSSSTVPFAFSYNVSGNNVKIDGTSYTYKNGVLITKEGTTAFTKTSYSNSDFDWLETAKYYVMPDNERLNIDFYHACTIDSKINENKYMISLHLGVKASAHASSRRITSVEAHYSIKGGTLSNSNTENVIVISRDEDYNTSTTTFVTTSSQATITASFYFYDSKNKEKKYAGSATYLVPSEKNDGNDDNGGDDNGGNGGDDNGGDNNYIGTVQGHEYINLRLPSGTLWATMNVGAEKPEDYGEYFLYGRSNSDVDNTVKPNSADYVDYNISGTSYDMAKANWGSKWKLPTKEQFEELIEECSVKWTQQNSIYGMKFTSKTNNQSIFFPAAGFYSMFFQLESDDKYSLNEAKKRGNYWTGQREHLENEGKDVAYILYFSSSGASLSTKECTNSIFRYFYRLPVRPVTD